MKHKTITIIPILIALQVVAAVMTTGRYSQQMKQIKQRLKIPLRSSAVSAVRRKGTT